MHNNGVNKMTYKEITYDLFRYIEEHKENGGIAVAHCISRDLAMGAGIAKKFTEYGIKELLLQNASSCNNYEHSTVVGVVSNKYNTPLYNVLVYNLITKEKYFEKPTYGSLRASLVSLKYNILKNNEYYTAYDNSRIIKTLVMPKIGCGLDRLEWSNVKEMINAIFSEIDIDIVICKI